MKKFVVGFDKNHDWCIHHMEVDYKTSDNEEPYYVISSSYYYGVLDNGILKSQPKYSYTNIPYSIRKMVKIPVNHVFDTKDGAMAEINLLIKEHITRSLNEKTQAIRELQAAMERLKVFNPEGSYKELVKDDDE